MLCGFGFDVNLAFRFGQLAVSLADRESTGESDSWLSWTYFIVGALVRHWSHSIREFTFDDLAFAEKKALEVGQIGLALTSRIFMTTYSMSLGSSLNSTKLALKEIVRVARLYRQEKLENYANIPLQFIYCLQGSAPHPGRLTGNVLDFEEFLAQLEALDRQLFISTLFYHCMEVAFFIGDLDSAFKATERLLFKRNFPSSTYFTPVIRYRQALVLLAYARKYPKQRKRCVKKAKEILAQIRKLVLGSPSNFRFMQHMLEAEFCSLSVHADVEKTSELYERAIAEATSEEVTNEVATGCELFAEFKERSGNYAGAMEYYVRSEEYYENWGAKVKSQMLLDKISDIARRHGK